MNTHQLKTRIQAFLGFFIFFLIISGLTAFPLESELCLLNNWTQHAPDFIRIWISDVYSAIRDTNTHYPFMAYGTDWLAFAHLIIALVFIGPLMDPVRNIWVIRFGMIACILIFPLAFICGPIRHIPLYWSLIDCSFGVFGFIPLYICYRYTRRLEKLNVQPTS